MVCALLSHLLTVFSIYQEIGAGRRVALSKLAAEKFEETGRPLRIAIDVSIWLFQIQASKGELFSPSAGTAGEAWVAKLMMNRRHQPRVAHLLLPPPPPHRPLYPPRLCLRRPEQTALQTQQAYWRPGRQCCFYSRVSSQATSKTVWIPHTPRPGRS